MKDLVIIGSGGFGREVQELVEEINAASPTWNFLGYIDDSIEGETIEGDKILGNLEYLCQLEVKPHAVIAIASASVRERIAKRCDAAGVPFATIIHPTVKLRGHLCTVGEGTIMCEGAGTAINCHIGKHCIFNMFSGMGHDSVMEDFSSMMSHTTTGGDVHIGKGCYFGLRCTVINQITIGDNCTFGAGAVVVRDALEAGTYVGVPAKMIKKYIAPEEV